MNAIAREHVRPFSFDNFRSVRKESDYKLEDIVPACKDCNNLLNNMMFDSIADKADYIARTLETKHKKILASPDWSEEDYSELGKSLKGKIKRMQYKKKILQARIGFAKERAKLVNLTPVEFWRNLGKI